MFNNHVFKVVSFKKESAEVMKVGKLDKSAVIRPLGSFKSLLYGCPRPQFEPIISDPAAHFEIHNCFFDLRHKVKVDLFLYCI